MSIKPIDKEPWVHLANEEELKTWSKEDTITYNQHNRQTEKALFYQRAFDFIAGNTMHGDYYEFGSHRARTFRMALTEARRQGFSDMRFFAFDSFEGLPQDGTKESSVKEWQPGQLSTSEEVFKKLIAEHGIYKDKVKTFKGFYDKSLTQELQETLIKEKSKIALVCIDCDLYESAVPVFNFIEPLLQKGSLIYIDDMFAGYAGSPEEGVSKAFEEHKKRSSFRFFPHLSIGWWGQSFIAY